MQMQANIFRIYPVETFTQHENLQHCSIQGLVYGQEGGRMHKDKEDKEREVWVATHGN